MAKCQKGKDEMSEKIVVSASISEAYKSANFIAELMSDNILAWTATASPERRSETKGWESERYVVIKAVTRLSNAVFLCQVYKTSCQEPACWKTESIAVSRGLADPKIFDFAKGFDNNGFSLLEELRELKNLSCSFLIDHLLTKKSPEKVLRLVGNLGSKFNLFHENDNTYKLIFSDFSRDSSINRVLIYARWREVSGTYEGTKICIFYKNGKSDVWPSSATNR